MPKGAVNMVYRRLFVALLAFVIVMVAGTIGYLVLDEDETDLLDALYMTTITISTIGFEEVIDLTHNPKGRLFTIILAFLGIGINTYLISTIAALIIEGDIQEDFKKRKVRKMIRKLENHYIVCGIGRVGQTILEDITTGNNACAFVDLDENKVNGTIHIGNGVSGIVGDCTLDDTLLELGILEASGIFACTDDDNINLVTCLTARQLNPSVRIISACKNPDFRNKLLSVGVDKVISPHSIGGSRMAAEMVSPGIMSFMDEVRSEYTKSVKLVEFHVPKRYKGCQLGEIIGQQFEKSKVLAVCDKGHWTYLPPNNFVLSDQVNLIVMTTPDEKKHLDEIFSNDPV